jgi:uridine kinase
MADDRIRELVDRIEAVRRPHPIRVAIDGIDAAGKTTLANELASVLRRRGRDVVRASIDGFHRPRAERYSRGDLSAEGYYLDSFELVEHWDLRIFVSVEPEEALRRALDRDTPLFGSREVAERRYRLRYQPGQRLYFAEARPLEAADVVVRTGRAGSAPR